MWCACTVRWLLSSRHISFDINLVVCTVIVYKEPHGQVDVDRVIASGTLGSVMVTVSLGMARSGDLSPVLGQIFPIYMSPGHEYISLIMVIYLTLVCTEFWISLK